MKRLWYYIFNACNALRKKTKYARSVMSASLVAMLTKFDCAFAGIDTTAAVAQQFAALDRKLFAMLANADFVMFSILIGLSVACGLTWIIGIVKGLQLSIAQRRASKALAVIYDSATLEVAQASIGSKHLAFEDFLAAGESELERSAGLGSIEGIKERIAMRLQRIEAAHDIRISKGISLLATIGATAPFVGLFGTVWGVLNGFLGGSKTQNVNFAFMAPSIAEALIVTVLGLVAAIPAIIVHDLLARGVLKYRAKLGDAASEVMRLVGRDLDRQLPLAAQRR